MVVGFSAKAIDSFTIIAAQNINDLVVDQTLQRAIDRGQTNAFAFTLHQSINFLRAGKSTSALKGAQNPWVGSRHYLLFGSS
jgi:hypothetical protein